MSPTLTPLTTLRPTHPRLLLTPDSLTQLRHYLKTNPQFQSIYADVRTKADQLLANPNLLEYKLCEPRKTLLDVARDALVRITTLSLTYLLSNDRKYADCAIAEMLAAADFPNWHPEQFLDTAELSTALALGYDWLFDLLTPADRTKIKTALFTHAFTPAERCYAGLEPWGWWVKDRYNWNTVCNCGIVIAALALADEEPDRCQPILTSALQSSRIAFDRFPADGGWDEGPGYWAYTTVYIARYLSALQSALGTTFNLDQTPGLAQTPLFPLYFLGPLGLHFNFADTMDYLEWSSQLFWLSTHFNQPATAYAHRQEAAAKISPYAFGSTRSSEIPPPKGHTPPTLNAPEDLLWFTDAGSPQDIQKLPLDKHFPTTQLAFFRSQWLDPNALWLAFKGGDNKANHSHLDLGSFVLDALGQRWALDLGRENYGLPGYFSDQRFSYYRLRTPSHNTLTLNNQDQDKKAEAPITHFLSTPNRAHLIANLSAAYPTLATQLHRGIAMLHRHQILIQDELTAPTPVTPTWNFHTPAQIELTHNNTQATLTLAGKTLHLQILTPAGAQFKIQSNYQPPPEYPNTSTQNLTIHFPSPLTTLRLAVLITPNSPATQLPEIQPLTEWPQS